MKNSLKYIYASILLILALLAGCQKCKKEIKPDPCLGVKKANFKIYEKVVDSLFETDKALKNNFIIFQADEDYESYEWKVGNDARTWKTKKMSLRFADITIPLEIRLIAKRKPRPDCIPNDDGVDTIVKPFQIVSDEKSQILGEFQGYSQEGTSLVGDPLNTFKISIYQEPGYPVEYGSFVVDNFIKGHYPRYFASGLPVPCSRGIGYRAMHADYSNIGFRGWVGIYHIPLNTDSIHISGQYDRATNPINIKFKGERI